MSIRFRSNNLIAILIAVILIATGAVLALINKQSQSEGAGSKSSTHEVSKQNDE